MTATTTTPSPSSPYLPFNPEDPVWADIKPTYQHESSNPLCPIMYAPEYATAMDLYRSLVAADDNGDANDGKNKAHVELSPRALALTEHLVRLNPSHYSIWQYRAKILIEGPPHAHAHAHDVDVDAGSSLSNSSPPEEARKRALRAELDFLDQLAHENMKSYQVWQHRRLIVSALGDPSRELEFVAANLERDAKNYHTWAYRQWVLAHFGGLGFPPATTAAAQTTSRGGSSGSEDTTTTTSSSSPAGPGAGAFPSLWDGELDYTEKLLNDDVRNNSAWNHRWFCIFGRRGTRPAGDPRLGQTWDEGMAKIVRAELGFTKAQIALAPNNASAWNYLRGVHVASPVPTALGDSLGFAKSLISTPLEAERDPAVDRFGRSPPQAIEWCVDCVEERLDRRGEKMSSEEKKEAVIEVDKLVTRLCFADPIRKRFWGYRLQSVRRKAATS